jgi:hypothetical protein
VASSLLVLPSCTCRGCQSRSYYLLVRAGVPVLGVRVPVLGVPVFGVPVFGVPVFGVPVFEGPSLESPTSGVPALGVPVAVEPMLSLAMRRRSLDLFHISVTWVLCHAMI